MTRRILTILIALVSMATMSWAQFESAPAFPGAEGHGRFVTGGRGGTVIHVTNLNDKGTGSLRAAVSGNSAKIIVFDVGGVIPLASDLSIGSNTTIEGQTAPAPGITIRYYTVSPGENNIIRFIRFRRGQEKDVNDGADACWQRNKTGLMLDHCSFSWSIDEVASFYDNNNFTMQWCTIAESLVNAGHDKGAHGYGGIWGGKLASFHHNMIAHVANRGPRFNGARYEWTGYTSNKEYSKYKWQNPIQAENVDFRNCVMYNASGTCYGGPGGGQINMVNNYYKSGPAGGNAGRVTLVTVGAEGNSAGHPNTYNMTSRYYISGNTTQAASNGAITKNRDWNGVSYDDGTLTVNGLHYSKDANGYYPDSVPSTTSGGVKYVRLKMDYPAPTGYVTTHTAAKAYEKVLSYVGASLNRDDVDARYVKECTNATATYKGSVTGKAGLIDVVSDVNGYTEANFGTGSRPEGFDTDGDGMPDEWETKWGLDPANAADAKKYTLDSKGYYTNIEMYCNSLVDSIMQNEVADGDANYTEYWPELKKSDPTEPTSEVVSLEISQATNTGTNTTAAWNFNTSDYDVTVTNTAGKSYAAGKDNTIKYSNGKLFTINIPDGITVNEVTFTGYDNYNGADAYLSKLNDVTYDATKYVFPQKTADGITFTTSYTIPTEATGSLNFQFENKQVCMVITLKGTLGSQKVYGDVNGDGKVTIEDLFAVIDVICGKATYAAADINGDNTVNVQDANIVIYILCGGK